MTSPAQARTIVAAAQGRRPAGSAAGLLAQQGQAD